jgi:transporter family-2 protein
VRYTPLHRLENAVQALLYVLALGAGVSVALQQVLNGGLRTALGSPTWAGFVSYVGC